MGRKVTKDSSVCTTSGHLAGFCFHSLLPESEIKEKNQQSGSQGINLLV